MKVIGKEAFSRTDAQQIIISNGTQQIDSKSFAYCKDLVIVYIPLSVNAISADAFEGSERVLVVCESGSYAEQFAISNGLDYCVNGAM